MPKSKRSRRVQGSQGVLGDAAEFWSDLVIVLTVIVHTLIPYMPGQRRVLDTAELRNELQELLLHAERQWYELSEGQLNNRQISGLPITIRERKSSSDLSHFDWHTPTISPE